jgi:hypothetical protein
MEADGVVQIRDAKNRYAAGMLKYAQIGYRDDDYVPSDTDVLAVFRVTAQEGVDAMRPRQRPASPRIEQVVVGNRSCMDGCGMPMRSMKCLSLSLAYTRMERLLRRFEYCRDRLQQERAPARARHRCNAASARLERTPVHPWRSALRQRRAAWQRDPIEQVGSIRFPVRYRDNADPARAGPRHRSGHRRDSVPEVPGKQGWLRVPVRESAARGRVSVRRRRAGAPLGILRGSMPLLASACGRRRKRYRCRCSTTDRARSPAGRTAGPVVGLWCKLWIRDVSTGWMCRQLMQ